MLQNCWHSERKLLASGNADSTPDRRKTTKRGRPHFVASPLIEPVMSSGNEVFSPVDNRTAASVLFPQPVDKFVDSSSSFYWQSRRDRKGVSVVDN